MTKGEGTYTDDVPSPFVHPTTNRPEGKGRAGTTIHRRDQRDNVPVAPTLRVGLVHPTTRRTTAYMKYVSAVFNPEYIKKDLALSITCPTCHREPGKMCFNRKTGYVYPRDWRYVHRPRRDMAEGTWQSIPSVFREKYERLYDQLREANERVNLVEMMTTFDDCIPSEWLDKIVDGPLEEAREEWMLQTLSKMQPVTKDDDDIVGGTHG